MSVDSESEYVVVLITSSSPEEKDRISRSVIERKLAACVSSVAVESIFRWQGAVEQANEHLLLVKTRRAVFRQLVQCVRELHSYEVPEIVAVPIVCGYQPYLDWIGENTAADTVPS